jgi:hypothetical protein
MMRAARQDADETQAADMRDLFCIGGGDGENTPFGRVSVLALQ